MGNPPCNLPPHRRPDINELWLPDPLAHDPIDEAFRALLRPWRGRVRAADRLGYALPRPRRSH
jgi:hypothetical protein